MEIMYANANNIVRAILFSFVFEMRASINSSNSFMRAYRFIECIIKCTNEQSITCIVNEFVSDDCYELCTNLCLQALKDSEQNRYTQRIGGWSRKSEWSDNTSTRSRKKQK